MNVTRLLEHGCGVGGDATGGGLAPIDGGGVEPGGVARDRDRDLAAAGDDALNGALGLQVEHVDDVAFGAAFQRLAANGEIDAGHLVDQRDGLVALHEIGLGRDRRSAAPGRRAAAGAPACRPPVARWRRRRRPRPSAGARSRRRRI